MSTKLDIFTDIELDESIVKEELHTYQPFGSNKFAPADEIRIVIQCQDLITATFDSFIYIEGHLSGNLTNTNLTNNAMAFLFDEVRYELCGQVVDSIKLPGISTTMKSLVSYNDVESKSLQVAGWSYNTPTPEIQHTDKSFTACIPLKFLLGFAEDYRKVIINSRQELILIRSRRDANSFLASHDVVGGTGIIDEGVSVNITKIEWKVPHIHVNDELKLQLLSKINGNVPIIIPYRKWELFELPSLRPTKTDIWPIKTSTNLEKPRYILVAFQTNRKDNKAVDSSVFDHVNLTNIRLHLNSSSFPYELWNLDISRNNYVMAYQSYIRFQKSYYGREDQPLMTYKQFKENPIFVIDCSRQSEHIKQSTVDIKLEFESAQNFTDSIVAYALILHDALVEYRPLTGELRKY